MIWIVLIVIASTGIALWRPLYGLSAIIVLWPTYLLRTAIVGIPTTTLELALYGVTAAVGLRWLLGRESWHWARITRQSWWLLGLWVLAWVVAVIASPARPAGLGALKAWLVDPLLFAALLSFVVRTAGDRRQIIGAAIISGATVALAGLAQLVWFRDTLQEGRLSSFFAPVANYAAMYLGPLTVLAGALLLFRERNGVWWWLLGGMSVALVLTLSFGAYLAVACGLLVAWSQLPSGMIKRRLLQTGIAAVILGALIISQTKNFSQHFTFTGRSSGLVRTQIWVTSWALIQQHPWFGVGPNNFEAAYRAELPKHYFPPLEWLVAQPHNLYLALWLETGLLGLLTFLALVVYHFRIVWRDFLPHPENRAVAVASLAALVTILIHGLVDTPYFKNDSAMEFMLVAALPWLGRESLKD
ncbi:MAG: O-antigen ligase family protein [Candidatus Kerfeldbacteria bacterium]|nr:O-antigen ligase family protein [Candidatus Kerfeldbacteria bacterium]